MGEGEWIPPCQVQGPPGCGCAATGWFVSVAVMEQMKFPFVPSVYRSGRVEHCYRLRQKGLRTACPYQRAGKILYLLALRQSRHRQHPGSSTNLPVMD